MDMEKLVSLCKRRGFIFPSSEIYGGPQRLLGLRPARRRAEAEHQGRLVEGQRPGSRRHGRPRLLDHHEPQGLGGVRPRRRVQRPDGRLPARRKSVTGPTNSSSSATSLGSSIKLNRRSCVSLSWAGRRKMQRPPSTIVSRRSASKGLVPVRTRDLPEPSVEPLPRLSHQKSGFKRIGPAATQVGTLTEPRAFNLMFKTNVGAVGERLERRLSAPRDRAGDLRQLQERGRHRPREDPLRDRPDRQELPQRDHPAQLHLPLARVRADGDRVLLPPRRGRRVVRLLAQDAVPVVRRPRPRERASSASATTTRTNWPSTRPPRPTSSTPSRSASASWKGSPTGAITTSPSTRSSAARTSATSTRSARSGTSRTSSSPRPGPTGGRWPFLCEAYTEDEVGGETRTVMKFHPRFAPIKAAVFPLVKKDGMPEMAEKIYRDLKRHFNVFFDEKGAIGRRYRRQDEAGTPFGITVDGQTARRTGPSPSATATACASGACRPPASCRPSAT